MERGQMVMELSHKLFERPYCEPGKVAGVTLTCLLLLEQEQMERLAGCVKDTEELLKQTAPGKKGIYDTRLHLFLRSPWPTFRLLDLLVKLHPKDEALAVQELAPCRAHEDLHGQPLEFDWPWFKSALISALPHAIKEEVLLLRPVDGPLSEQYRARWSRVYKRSDFRDAAAFSSDAFYRFRRGQWEAGCHPGIVAAYVMQVVTFCIRDSEAWLHRYVGAAWQLLNLLVPLSSLVYSDWPVYQALYLGSLLRRHPSPWRPGTLLDALMETGLEAAQSEVDIETSKSLGWGGPAPARDLHALLHGALQDLLAAKEPPGAVYVTACWGSFNAALPLYLQRWEALQLPPLVLLGFDLPAAEACRNFTSSGEERLKWLRCLQLPEKFGVEAAVAKYISLAVVVSFNLTAVWLDLDVYLAKDPTEKLKAALAAGDAAIGFGTFWTSKSISPSIIVAQSKALDLLMRYAAWMHEHPYIHDDHGWDSLFERREGDFSGGWDYKGRNITSNPSDGLTLSFAPTVEAPEAAPEASPPPRYVVLGGEFASCDGWSGRLDDLLTFHFLGAHEPQDALLQAFYPFSSEGFSSLARAVLAQYRREPVSLDFDSTAGRAADATHVVTVSYAHGCCAQALERNRQSALDAGADEARAYGFEDLDPYWAARNAEILSQKKGGGWWLWKPHVILKTLRDASVPWHTGIVVWLDAGNHFFGDIRALVNGALRHTDITAMRLKCCVERDWTSVESLRLLGGDGYAIADRPQLGAYLLLFRKTSKTLAFVEEWLRLSEDPAILLEPSPASRLQQAPNYQRHMADQSVFSVLFKQWGFQAMSLEEGHKAVRLERWRD